MWYVYTVEYYSVVQNNEIMKFGDKLIKVWKKIFLGKLSRHRNRNNVFLFKYSFKYACYNSNNHLINDGGDSPKKGEIEYNLMERYRGK